MPDLNKITRELKKNGFCIIPNFLNKKLCEKYIKILENILIKRLNKKKFVGGKKVTILFNYFLENPKLFNLIFDKKIDKVLKHIIDDDYVLMTATARNQSISKFKIDINNKTSGQKWHRDNKSLKNKMLFPAVNYIVAIALDEFSKKNGSTMYIKNSHKIFDKKIKMNKTRYLEAEQGSLIFMNSNLIHKAGPSSSKRRWSIFNIYSPWYIKPYFRFNELLDGNKLNKNLRKILHFTSLPPKNYDEGIKTLKID